MCISSQHDALWLDPDQPETYQRQISNFMDYCDSVLGPVCASHLLLLRFYNVKNDTFFETREYLSVQLDMTDEVEEAAQLLPADCEEKVKWVFGSIMDSVKAQRVVCGASKFQNSIFSLAIRFSN